MTQATRRTKVSPVLLDGIGHYTATETPDELAKSILESTEHIDAA